MWFGKLFQQLTVLYTDNLAAFGQCKRGHMPSDQLQINMATVCTVYKQKTPATDNGQMNNKAQCYHWEVFNSPVAPGLCVTGCELSSRCLLYTSPSPRD